MLQVNRLNILPMAPVVRLRIELDISSMVYWASRGVQACTNNKGWLLLWEVGVYSRCSVLEHFPLGYSRQARASVLGQRAAPPRCPLLWRWCLLRFGLPAHCLFSSPLLTGLGMRLGWWMCMGSCLQDKWFLGLKFQNPLRPSATWSSQSLGGHRPISGYRWGGAGSISSSRLALPGFSGKRARLDPSCHRA